MPFDPDEKITAVKLDMIDVLGLRMKQLYTDAKHNILVVNMDLDEHGDFMYDLDEYNKIHNMICQTAPDGVHVISLLPGISLEVYTKEEIQNYINSLQQFLDDIK